MLLVDRMSSCTTVTHSKDRQCQADEVALRSVNTHGILGNKWCDILQMATTKKKLSVNFYKRNGHGRLFFSFFSQANLRLVCGHALAVMKCTLLKRHYIA